MKKYIDLATHSCAVIEALRRLFKNSFFCDRWQNHNSGIPLQRIKRLILRYEYSELQLSSLVINKPAKVVMILGSNFELASLESSFGHNVAS